MPKQVQSSVSSSAGGEASSGEAPKHDCVRLYMGVRVEIVTGRCRESAAGTVISRISRRLASRITMMVNYLTTGAEPFRQAAANRSTSATSPVTMTARWRIATAIRRTTARLVRNLAQSWLTCDIATRQGAIRSLAPEARRLPDYLANGHSASVFASNFSSSKVRTSSRILHPLTRMLENGDVVYVIETKLGTGPRDRPSPRFRVLERCLRAIIPAANPDFEDFYGSVCKWWIEIDAGGVPQRELGFDEQGNVIAAAPMGSNFGFFTDSNAVFVVEDHSAVEASLFDATWLSFESRWAQEHR